MAETPVRPWTETKVVGTAQPRIDGYERVSGSAVYARDLVLPGMLHAAFARCPHAHANVKRVDVSRALKMPGVRAVVTGDSPGAKLPLWERRKARCGSRRRLRARPRRDDAFEQEQQPDEQCEPWIERARGVARVCGCPGE